MLNDIDRDPFPDSLPVSIAWTTLGSRADGDGVAAVPASPGSLEGS
jgi:hypothetical protein